MQAIKYAKRMMKLRFKLTKEFFGGIVHDKERKK